jgi:hypothetical protein
VASTNNSNGNIRKLFLDNLTLAASLQQNGEIALGNNVLSSFINVYNGHLYTRVLG